MCITGPIRQTIDSRELVDTAYGALLGHGASRKLEVGLWSFES